MWNVYCVVDKTKKNNKKTTDWMREKKNCAQKKTKILFKNMVHSCGCLLVELDNKAIETILFYIMKDCVCVCVWFNNYFTDKSSATADDIRRPF